MNIVVEPGPAEVGHGGKCNSRLRQSEGRCRKTAGWGTDHQGVGACRLHGGSTRTGRKAAEQRKSDLAVAELLAEHMAGRDGVADPHQELLRIISLSAGMVWVYERLVGELMPGGASAYVVADEVGGIAFVPAQPAGLWGPDHKGDAKPHEAVRALGEWSDRHARNCKIAVDAGVQKRQIEIAEEMAQAVASAFRVAAAGFLELAAENGGAPELQRALEAGAPGVLRRALNTLRVGAIDVTDETTET